MKNILLVVIGVFLAYSALKRCDAVQSIDFRGENYTLFDQYTRARSDVFMYTPGGENFLRAGKYIQVAYLPKAEMSAEEYRKQYMESLQQAVGYVKISEASFFYIEANTLVHSALIQQGDKFKLYGYAEVLADSTSGNLNDHSPDQAIAREFEATIRNLPPPPRSISTWF